MVQENPTKTTFKGDNVNTLVKTSKCENLLLSFSEKDQKIAAFAMLFLVFSDQTITASPKDQKYPRYPLVLKLNVTLAWPLRLVILYFFNGKPCQMIGPCIFMTANETRDLMWMGSPIQNNC